MELLKSIPGINLIILVGYTLFANILNAASSDPHKGLGLAMILALLIGIQVIVNIITSLVKFANKEKRLGKLYLLSAGLVLVIGFSTCFGSMSL